MSCLGGTREEPKTWVRFRALEQEHIEGRWCDREQPFTSRRSCSACPAYRGTRWDGSTASGIAPNGDVVALSLPEYEEYERALEASFEDDDFSLLRMLLDKLDGGIGQRTMREAGDPDAQDVWSRYMRAYRTRMSDEQRARQRETTRLRVARHRAAKRASACNVSNPGASHRDSPVPARAPARTRARERGAYVTEEATE